MKGQVCNNNFIFALNTFRGFYCNIIIVKSHLLGTNDVFKDGYKEKRYEHSIDKPIFVFKT